MEPLRKVITPGTDKPKLENKFFDDLRTVPLEDDAYLAQAMLLRARRPKRAPMTSSELLELYSREPNILITAMEENYFRRKLTKGQKTVLNFLCGSLRAWSVQSIARRLGYSERFIKQTCEWMFGLGWINKKPSGAYHRINGKEQLKKKHEQQIKHRLVRAN